jgi:hypothetical protein
MPSFSQAAVAGEPIRQQAVVGCFHALRNAAPGEMGRDVALALLPDCLASRIAEQGSERPRQGLGIPRRHHASA